MFGTHLLDRRSKPERIADQAWEYLLSAAGTAKAQRSASMARTFRITHVLALRQNLTCGGRLVSSAIVNVSIGLLLR